MKAVEFPRNRYETANGSLYVCFETALITQTTNGCKSEHWEFEHVGKGFFIKSSRLWNTLSDHRK